MDINDLNFPHFSYMYHVSQYQLDIYIRNTFWSCSQLNPAREKSEIVGLKFTFDMNIAGENTSYLGDVESKSHLKVINSII